MTLTLDGNAALTAIDVQAAFDPPASSRAPMETQGLRLVEAWRRAGRPLIHVRHDSTRPGANGEPGFEPRGDEPLVAKTVNAALIGTDLDLRLRRLGVREIVRFGLTADTCVSTSARGGANLGYRVVVVGDASASFALTGPDGVRVAAADIHRAHLATLHAGFATVTDTDAVLAALARPVACAA